MLTTGSQVRVLPGASIHGFTRDGASRYDGRKHRLVLSLSEGARPPSDGEGFRGQAGSNLPGPFVLPARSSRLLGDGLALPRGKLRGASLTAQPGACALERLWGRRGFWWEEANGLLDDSEGDLVYVFSLGHVRMMGSRGAAVKPGRIQTESLPRAKVA